MDWITSEPSWCGQFISGDFEILDYFGGGWELRFKGIFSSLHESIEEAKKAAEELNRVNIMREKVEALTNDIKPKDYYATIDKVFGGYPDEVQEKFFDSIKEIERSSNVYLTHALITEIAEKFADNY